MLERRLVCVRCRFSLLESSGALECEACGAGYAIIEDVPIVLPESLSEQQRSQARYFDAEFSRYRKYEPENWRLSFVRRIFGALGLDEHTGPYLDVGVGGSGATVIEAARLGIEATGCDLSVAGVLQASRLARGEKVAHRASFVACAAESLPFPDETFGRASAVAVLEHLDDDASAVRELARVVRPGGLVWITVPLAYRYILPPLWPAYLLHDRRLGHKRHYDDRALAKVAEAAGLTHVESTYTGHFVKVVQLALDRLLARAPARRDRLWWSLERLDLRAARRAYGALQLNAVLRREQLEGTPA